MADFSMSLKGLSLEAQKFLFEKDIENGDGMMTASERNKLTEYLSGKESFPDGYADVKEEIMNFARAFDVKATENNLSKERKNAVRGNMFEGDKNAIDCINDYNRLVDVVNGQENYTLEQREYARALLENSPKARSYKLEIENEALEAKNQELLAEKGVLETKNQELLEENQALKSELAELHSQLDSAQQEKTVAQEALNSLRGMPTNISMPIKEYVNRIDLSNNKIIDTCKKYDDTVENFKKGTITEASLKKMFRTVKETVQREKENIEQAKQEGQEALQKELAKKGLDEAGKATLTPLLKLFAGAIIAGTKVVAPKNERLF